MQTPLSFQPPSPCFDMQQALSWIAPEADWVGLRHVQESTHHRAVRNLRPEQNALAFEQGAMVEVLVEGQIAYAATSDLSEAGLVGAARRAVGLAKAAARFKPFGLSVEQRPPSRGRYASPRLLGLDTLSLGEFTDRLMASCRQLKVSDKIVNATAEASFVESRSRYVSSNGADIDQEFLLVSSNFAVVAQDGGSTQRRSLNGPVARCQQAGLEAFDFEALYGECERVGREALALLAAEQCPSETLDLILAPDQMLLQIHESIGHPLELDRILGDERNYAGWSFVKPGDFGRLRYGSPCLNVTFDPALAGGFASYGFDDCGNPAVREYLIKDGLLLRGLGSLESQARLSLPGVANFRAAGWNRAPVDRMANPSTSARNC